MHSCDKNRKKTITRTNGIWANMLHIPIRGSVTQLHNIAHSSRVDNGWQYHGVYYNRWESREASRQRPSVANNEVVKHETTLWIHIFAQSVDRDLSNNAHIESFMALSVEWYTEQILRLLSKGVLTIEVRYIDHPLPSKDELIFEVLYPKLPVYSSINHGYSYEMNLFSLTVVCRNIVALRLGTRNRCECMRFCSYKGHLHECLLAYP